MKNLEAMDLSVVQWKCMSRKVLAKERLGI